MALTAQVKDELARLQVDKTSCRKAEVSATLRFAGGLHIISGRIVIEAELDTGHRRPPAAPGDRGGLRARRASHRRVRRAVCAAAAGTSCGWSRTASRSPARPACSTTAAARCAGCRRRSSPAASARPRPPGAARSSRTARSPSPAARRRSRSPARARRPRSRWSAPPGGSGIAAKAREVRGVDRVVIRDGDAISAMLTRLGAHDDDDGLGGAPHAARGARHRQPARQLRRRQPAPVRAGRGRGRRPGRAGVRDPRRRAARAPARGRRAAPRAQGGVARGAGQAGRPAADQGRRRRTDPAPAGDRRQARGRAGHPGHRGRA